MTASVERSRHGLRRGETASGWLFTAPMLALLGVFLAVPVLMALWVSVSDWGGRGSPFAGSVSFVGLRNYGTLLLGGGLSEQDFGMSLKNNAWYVLLVVPCQTALSLLLAVLVNRQILKGRGFFRTAFYFPSVTSSVAITVLFLFLFSTTGAVNAALGWLGINGPNWLNDPSGILHFGATSGPAVLTGNDVLGVSLWDWIGGPSVAMCVYIIMAVFTTSGTFMLLFLAALQNVSGEVQEAAMTDGANAWQRFWRITLPQLRPTLFTVLTLGLIGCWQVFDQIYTGSRGQPGKTTLTPAYQSYQASFVNQDWGQGAAIAFILFVIIIVFTLLQRWVLRERPVSRRRSLPYLAAVARATSGSAAGSAPPSPQPREEGRS